MPEVMGSKLTIITTLYLRREHLLIFLVIENILGGHLSIMTQNNLPSCASEKIQVSVYLNNNIFRIQSLTKGACWKEWNLDSVE